MRSFFRRLSEGSITILKWTSLLLLSCHQPQNSQNFQHRVVNEKEVYTINTTSDTAQINTQIRAAKGIWDKYPDSAKMLLRDAAQRSARQNYYNGYAIAYSSLGSKYKESANFDSSLYYLTHGLAASYRLPHSDYTAVIYACMGALYYDRSKFDTASLYMYKALASLESRETKKYQNAYQVYKIIGGFWLNIGNLENAIPYLDKAERLALSNKNYSLATDAQGTKGAIYQRKGLLDSAIKHYNKVLGSSHASPAALAGANRNMGLIYVLPQNKNLPRQAIPYFNEALRLSEGLGSRSQVAITNVYLGTAYLRLGEYNTAESMLREVIENGSRVGLGNEIVHAHQNLAAAYYHNKKYKLAFDQLFKAFSLNDSVFTKENLEMMGKLEVKYKIAEKDKLLAQKQLEITNQQSQIKERNLWLGGITSAGILVAALLISLFRNHKKQEEIARLKSMMQGEEKERARIAHELHDGIISELSAVKMHFSAIEYQVKEHTAAGDFREAMTQLEETTEELRKTSHNLMPEILIQSGIGIAVHSFCEKLPKGTTIHIDFQAYGEIPRLNLEFELTIYRIIQELVQNILKHAQASHILVQLSCDDQLLTVTVEDNGKGIPDQVLSDGMGLNNIKTRVKALDGQINIESSSAGTSIYLEFNINNHY